MWGHWVMSNEWAVGVFGSNVGNYYCSYLSVWDIFMGIASSFIVFLFVGLQRMDKAFGPQETTGTICDVSTRDLTSL